MGITKLFNILKKEIKENKELKQYLKMKFIVHQELKKKLFKKKFLQYKNEWVVSHRDHVREYLQKYVNLRYHCDPEFRERKKQCSKVVHERNRLNKDPNLIKRTYVKVID
jgi:hypothetical protein